MKHAKTPSSQNIKNFVLLGDPAVMLAYPFYNVRTLSINNEYSGKETDTLQALSHITITGQVEDVQGHVLDNFHGKLFPEIFDKPALYQTRANDHTSKVTDFQIQNKVLFKGEVTVKDGRFSFSFIVPKDISYQYGPGKISYYALDTNTFTDAQGYTEVYVGGADQLSGSDELGPEIQLYLNDTSFITGDVVNSSPVLVARLLDESGINTVGNGIGHDISAILDGFTQNPFILNDYFIPDADTYQSGWVVYPLGTLSPGTHTLSLKAWDIYNNSSEALVTFVIDTVSPLYLKKVINYPNPFRDGTNFSFTHNKPGSDFKVEIEIFGLDGRYICTLRYDFIAENLQSPPLFWDGTDVSGNFPGSGIYIFRLKAMAGQGKTAHLSQKMMIIR
jgi:hypothetical protein